MNYLITSLLIISGLLITNCSEKKSASLIQNPADALAPTEVQSKSMVFPQKWRSGGAPCQEAHYQVQSFGKDQFTIRQSKCLHYEAPFIHVIVGKDKILVMDSGAVEEQSYELINLILDLSNELIANNDMKIILAHTHSHLDHRAGDQDFINHERVIFVSHELGSIQSFYKLSNWPNKSATFDLGDRLIDVIPIPGHDETSLAFYDRLSKTLYTGDSLYPGRIYIQNFSDFKNSINRLVSFSQKSEIKLILGTHIEMSIDYSEDYPPRTVFHPNEAPLELNLSDLLEMHKVLKSVNPKDLKRLKKTILFPNFAP